MRTVFSRQPLTAQALVELALVMPLFLMTLFGIIILGIGVFYQQQLSHAAREAARYAAIHSATAVDPVVSNLPVNATITVDTNNSIAPDRPSNGWPNMTRAAQEAVFGLDPASVEISACWSGFWQVDSFGGLMPSAWDAGPTNGSGQPNKFLHCSLPNGAGVNVDPRTGEADSDASTPGAQAGGPATALPCASPLPQTTSANDTSSNLAWSQYPSGNEVTVYACYQWHPPLHGFLLIPQEVTLRAVVSEAMQHQR